MAVLPPALPPVGVEPPVAVFPPGAVLPPALPPVGVEPPIAVFPPGAVVTLVALEPPVTVDPPVAVEALLVVTPPAVPPALVELFGGWVLPPGATVVAAVVWIAELPPVATEPAALVTPPPPAAAAPPVLPPLPFPEVPLLEHAPRATASDRPANPASRIERRLWEVISKPPVLKRSSCKCADGSRIFSRSLELSDCARPRVTKNLPPSQ